MVLEALNRLEGLLRAAKDMPNLLAAYQQALTRLPAPRPSVYGDTTPFYTLGQQFATAMQDVGNTVGATQLRDQLGKLKVAAK
jgi:hypothetical protein